MTKGGGRSRHIPQRTCVGCRESTNKRTLVRLVRTPDGVVLDPSGKRQGRGAYVHDNPGCWELALDGSLDRALRTRIDEQERSELMEALAAQSTSPPNV